MNLHAIVAPIIGAVNPNQLITVLRSTGLSGVAADGSQQPAYATPGSLIGSIAGTVLTVTALSAGLLQPAQTLADGGAQLLAGTMITEQLTGAPGGVGTYSVSQSQAVTSETMSTTLQLFAQVQPASSDDLRHLDALNVQGQHRAVYYNGAITPAIRVGLRGGDLVVMADGSTWLVNESAEPFFATAGWDKVLITLQNGS